MRAAPYSRWFYVEQGEVGALDKPYRQHISAVHATSDGGFYPPFMLDPIDFAAIYVARQQQIAQQPAETGQA